MQGESKQLPHEEGQTVSMGGTSSRVASKEGVVDRLGSTGGVVKRLWWLIGYGAREQLWQC